MRMIVTGGVGFIGSNLVDQLVDHGHYVRIYDNLSTGKREYLNPKAEFIFADLAHATIDFSGFDYVFHLAALPRIQPSIKDPMQCHYANVVATLRVLIAARDAKVKRVIYSASSSAYGDNYPPLHEDMLAQPKSPYAAQKVMGEMYCKLFSALYALDTVCLRYFNVYGHRQATEGAYATVMGIWEQQVVRGEKVTIVGDGYQKRDFTHVSDAVEANIKAMQYDGKLDGQIINIGTGVNVTILGLAKWFGYDYEFIPAREGESRETLANNTKAKDILGWIPKVSLYESILRKSK